MEETSFSTEAISNLPENLCIRPSAVSGNKFGVWTTTDIAKDMIFGPYESSDNTEKKSNSEIEAVDAEGDKQELSTNWMRYINSTSNEEEQNLIAFQYNGQIFFRASKVIPPEKELLVFYEVKKEGILANMNRKLSLEQRVFLLQNWWKHDKKYAIIRKLFIEKYPAVEPPTRQAIYKLNKRFEETGAVVDLPRSGRPRTAVTDDNVRRVAKALDASPGKSTRKALAEFGITRTSYQRILKKLKQRASCIEQEESHFEQF
ncbi:uncharacterized protein [Centruroides vittatus]|uniref:uncharacterized protein isoform X2 n=1 Tax=Centruroides vittatus TaxID=120091 RepID=UPI00350F3896